MEPNMSEISRAVLFGKLDTLLFTSLESATAFCKLRGNPYVELVHWLHQLMQQQDGDLQHIIRHFALDEQALTRDIIAALDALPRGASSVSDLSEHIDSAVERAWVYGSLKYGVNRIRGGHLLIGLLKTWNLANVLKGISPQFSKINVDALSESFETLLAASKESQQAAVEAANTSATPTAQGTLAQYGQNLTLRAQEGKIDPVVGRDEEIRQMVDILMRRRQNNPLLTGEAGVGKTAVVEGLARRIAAGDVPQPLRNIELWLLDIGMLQAGAGMKGEFEARLQALINEVQSSPTPIVLFIDEIHRLSPVVEEVLYPAMEDYQLDIMIGEGPAARSIKIDLPPFTLIGATTRAGSLTSPLRDRFGIVQRLEFYQVPDLQHIVGRSARYMGLDMSEEGAFEVAKRSRGTPRIANRLLRRVRDFAEVKHDGTISAEIAAQALDMLNVDAEGFDYMDRKLLLAVLDKFFGGPVGLDNLAAAIGEERETIEDVLEPYLIQQGFLQRTPRGRMATVRAWNHFGITPPAMP